MMRFYKIPFALIGLFIWTAIAIIASTTAFIALKGNNWSLWLAIFKPMIAYYLLWGVAALIIFKLVSLFSNRLMHQIYSVPLHVLLFITITIGFNFLVHPSDWKQWLFGDRAAGYLTLSAMIYILVALGCFIIRYFQLLKNKEKQIRNVRLRESLLKNQLQLAQMNALKMQINPHFLFNSLNSIAALIEADKKIEAYDTTEMLGQLLRESLSASNKNRITVLNEIEIIERYIAMQALRFRGRFNIKINCDDALLNCLVPSFILQPLIENIFKHAVAHTNQPIEIELNINLDETYLIIQLINDLAVDDNPNDQPSFKTGLNNTDQRLQVLNGNGTWMKAEKNHMYQYIVTLKILQEKI